MARVTARSGERAKRLRRQAARSAPVGPRQIGQRRGAPERAPAPHAPVTAEAADTPAVKQERWPRAIEVLAVAVTAIAAMATVLVTREQALKEVGVTREGQITDRYTSAVSNLGDTAPEVRLGGIYALQRIMKDSPRDQPSIVDVLSAYIRTHAKGAEGKDAASARPAADVQAAFEVLAQRRPERDNRAAVDLREAHLPNVSVRAAAQGSGAEPGSRSARAGRARLAHANLSGAVLVSANLPRAQLNSAYFVGSRLPDANLRDADLRSALLVRARLEGAQLAGADLRKARPIDASFRNADLRGADLRGADLRGVDLHGAELKGADLRGADLRTARTRDSAGGNSAWESTHTTVVTARQLLTAKLDSHTELPPEPARDPDVRDRIERG
ncbi:pentapeptide repeat-containing protein [Streptomyces sp. 8N114]|uniref:pentapeptide repeat-containing protein n=1 Tax=Streptomyces sp. 8N114 TaxID=3457419 RepID=UPI003FD0CAE9